MKTQTANRTVALLGSIGLLGIGLLIVKISHVLTDPSARFYQNLPEFVKKNLIIT